MIYLDTAATSVYKVSDNIVVDTITDSMRQYWQNPSSLYATSVKEQINKCRTNVAKFIGSKSNEIYFTSSASESNNWVIRGWVDAKLISNYTLVNVITTPIEHKSILSAVNNKALGACVRYCEVDEHGCVDIQSLKRILDIREGEPILVSIGAANNEVGTLQDIKEISKLVHKYGGVLHVDATQMLPYISIDVDELGIDLLSASGHKISPVLKGVGFLYKRDGVDIQPLIYGSQEDELRGGTENVFGIIGLSKAVKYCCISDENICEMCTKRDYFIKQLKSKFGCRLNGHRQHRLPNNINVTFSQNITGESLLLTLDLSDIKVSVGSACNSKSIEPSYVLKAIGLSDDEAMRTVRFTLSDDITYSDIDYVVEEIDKAIKVIEL